MVTVTIREYKNGKCINTLGGLMFKTMVFAEDFVDELFDGYYGSGCIKATIEKIKQAPEEINFDDLEELVGELPLEEVVE